MKCPVSTIIATFLYLDRIDKEEKLLLKDGDVNKIIENIEKNLDTFIDNVQGYEKNKANLPNPDIPLFHMLTKHNLSSININNEKGNLSYRDHSKTFEARSKFNVDMYLESTELQTSDMINGLHKRTAESIELKDSDTKAYVASSVEYYLKQNFKTSLNSYLRDRGLIDEVTARQTSDLEDIIINNSTSENINQYVISQDSKVNELVLNFNDENIEKISNALENNEELYNYLESLDGYNLNDLLSYVRDDMNFRYKKDNLDLIQLRTDGFKTFKDNLQYKYRQNNEEFLASIDNAKELDFQLKINPTTDDIGFIFTKKTKSEESTRYARIVSQKEILTEKLNEKIKVPVVPSEMTINLSGSSSSSAFTVQVEYNKDEVELAMNSSDKSNASYFYNSSIINSGKMKILTMDESDNNPYSKANQIMWKVAKNAKNTISATGTGPTGKVDNMAPLLAQAGNIENPTELGGKFVEMAGVLKIKSTFVTLLMKAMVKNRDFAHSFRATLTEINQLKNNSKDRTNIQNTVEKYVINTLKSIKEDESLSQSLDTVNYFDALRVTQRLMSAISDDKNFYQKNIEHAGDKILKEFIFTSKPEFVQVIAGIQAGPYVSLLMSQSDVAFSPVTREGLTGKKENMNFVDRADFLDMKNRIYKNELTSDEIKRNKHGARLIRESLYKKAEMDFTSQVNRLLKDNFDLFVKAFRDTNKESKGNLDILTEASGLSKTDFLYATSSSGTSTLDSIGDLYSSYLENNGVITNEMTNLVSEKAMIAFKASLKVFQDEVIDKLILGKNEGEKSTYMMPYTAPSQFYSMFGENKDIKDVFFARDGYPYKKSDNLPYTFTIPVCLNKEAWTFLKEPIKENISLTNNSFNEIIDNFSSQGKEAIFENILGNEKRPVITSSRVASSVINVFDAIAAAAKREDKSKKILIIGVDNGLLKKSIEKIDENFLKENNIELKAVEINGLAVEVKKADGKRIQYAIVGNYTSIARGFSFANSNGGIIFTDGVDRVGDFIQAASRGMNPQENKLDSDISLFNGGSDTDLTMSYKEDPQAVKDVIDHAISLIQKNDDGEIIIDDSNFFLEDYAQDLILQNSIIKLKTTQKDELNREMYNHLAVYKGFTSGNLADRMETNISKIFSTTKQYENILDKKDDDKGINFVK